MLSSCSISFLFFSPSSVGAEWPYLSQCWAFGPNNIFHLFLIWKRAGYAHEELLRRFVPLSSCTAMNGMSPWCIELSGKHLKVIFFKSIPTLIWHWRFAFFLIFLSEESERLSPWRLCSFSTVEFVSRTRNILSSWLCGWWGWDVCCTTVKCYISRMQPFRPACLHFISSTGQDKEEISKNIRLLARGGNWLSKCVSFRLFILKAESPWDVQDHIVPAL